jgi:hypothetical protein
MMTSWINNNFNVLFHGRHGVGKTSMVFESFHNKGWELGTDYLYFSAATIDPWVDLIGVPTKVQNELGEDVIKLIRPENINNRSIKAFFVDELNRSHKKVRNAMMELIQFKSINGLKFPSLEIVWAAVNPDDDDELKFDVEKLDPAQEDRFHIHVQIPYKPNENYFAQKYNNPDMAEAVCKWWNDQPEKVKLQLTPRRLEYALEVFTKTNDLRFVVPNEAHIPSLKAAIQTGNPEKTLLKLIEEKDDSTIRKWLAIENNLSSVQNLICTNRAVCSKVLHLLSDERMASFAAKYPIVLEQFKSDPQKYEKIIRDIADNGSNKTLRESCVNLVKYLDTSANELRKIVIPRKPLHNISKRRKAQIFNNYAFAPQNEVNHINNQQEKLAAQLVTIAAETNFADNSTQKINILQKLSDIVHPNMSEDEATIALQILDYTLSFSFDKKVEVKYMPLINSCILSYAKVENHTIATLFKIAPNLLVNVVLKYLNNFQKSKLKREDFSVSQIANEEFADIPDDVEAAVKQSIEDLF